MYRQHPLREIRANITSHVSNTSTLPGAAFALQLSSSLFFCFISFSNAPDCSKVPHSLSVLQSIAAVCWWEALREKCNQGQWMDHVEKLEECFSAARLLSPAAARTARRRMWFRRHILTALLSLPPPQWLITARGRRSGRDQRISGQTRQKGGKVGRALRMSGAAGGWVRGAQTVDCAHAPHTCEWLVVCGLR